MQRLRIALAVSVGLVATCALGPRHKAGPVDRKAAAAEVSEDLGVAVDHIMRSEREIEDLREGDASRFHWAEQEGARTALSLVYLHGYSASPVEIEPVLERLSHELGANVYAPRLRGHGRTPEAMGPVKAGTWFEEVEQALHVGGLLGEERTVLIGTSTGGTLAALAALEHPELAGLILLSPNFGTQDQTTEALLLPWLGVLLTRVLPDHCWEPSNEAQGAHWTTCYPISSVASMMVVVDAAHEADWSGLEVPVLVLRSDDDTVVQQEVIETWLEHLEGPKERVLIEAAAGESGHVLAGDITAPSKTDFAVETLATWIRALPAERAPSELRAP